MIKTICKSLYKSLLVLTLLSAFSANAGLYKGLDADGNVVYSDTPFENAEKLTPPPITVLDAPKANPGAGASAEEEEDKPAETKYTRLVIESPHHDQVIWNQPAVNVSLKLTPALNTAQGHRIWLLMDGKTLVKNNPNLSMSITNADRGEHTLQAQVRNKKGKILVSSSPVTVHIKKSVVPRAVQ